MKSIIAMCLLGLISSTQAAKYERSLIRLNVNEYAEPVAPESSEDDDTTDEEDESNIQLAKPCVYLDETPEELTYQMDMFSRTLNPLHLTNAQNIAAALTKASGVAPKLSITTYELYDKAFSFPRIRRYGFV
jgi:hypothetical protein